MTTFTVGRLGFDVAVTEVAKWDQSGDQISVSGQLLAASVADAKVLRQQLAGYVNNPDEEIVPVTWSEDPTVDGYYRVTGADVSTVPMSLTAGWFNFSLSLERVAGYAGPLIESVIVGAVRVNSHSITSSTAVGVVGVPDSVTEFWDTGASLDVFTRAGDGIVLRLGKSATYTRRQSFALAPGDYYDGAATIEFGATPRVVVGQQVQSETTNWRLSNGLLRVTPAAGGFSLSCYDGAAWDTAKVFALTAAGGVAIGNLGYASGVRVLRNTPEEVIIRIAFAADATILTALSIEAVRYSVDLALRRGDRVARGTVTSDASTTWGVEAVTAEAGTSITAALRATSNDAAGNRYVLISPNAITKDTTQGGIYLTAGAAKFSFAAGLEVAGTGAAANDAAADMVLQYMVAGSERQLVVTR